MFYFCDGSLLLQIRGKWGNGGLIAGAAGVMPCTNFIACSGQSSDLKAVPEKFAWLCYTLCLCDLSSSRLLLKDLLQIDRKLPKSIVPHQEEQRTT